MSKIEGVKNEKGGFQRSASFFHEGDAPISTGDWLEVVFKDYEDVIFESTHIHIAVSGGVSVNYSFDPRSLPSDPDLRKIHGRVAADGAFTLRNKRATSIYIRSTGAASALEITAWR